MALYNAYRIVRQGGGDGAGDGDGRPRARYFVQRPDGTECCRDVTWGEAERAIQRDMRANRWPADSLPPPRKDADGQGRAGAGERQIPSTAELDAPELTLRPSSAPRRRVPARRSASPGTAG
jgi:hypothetical protein